mgnify:FL=1
MVMDKKCWICEQSIKPGELAEGLGTFGSNVIIGYEHLNCDPRGKRFIEGAYFGVMTIGDWDDVKRIASEIFNQPPPGSDYYPGSKSWREEYERKRDAT